MEVLVFLVQFLHRVNKLPFPVLQMQDLALTYFKIPHPAEEGNPPPPSFPLVAMLLNRLQWQPGLVIQRLGKYYIYITRLISPEGYITEKVKGPTLPIG